MWLLAQLQKFPSQGSNNIIRINKVDSNDQARDSPICTPDFTFLPGCTSNVKSSCDSYPATRRRDNKTLSDKQLNIDLKLSLVSMVELFSMFFFS